MFVDDSCHRWVSKARPQAKPQWSSFHTPARTLRNCIYRSSVWICRLERGVQSNWLIMARSWVRKNGNVWLWYLYRDKRGSSRDGCKFIVSYLLDPMTVYSLFPLFYVMLCLTHQVSQSSGCVPQGSWHSHVPGRWQRGVSEYFVVEVSGSQGDVINKFLFKSVQLWLSCVLAALYTTLTYLLAWHSSCCRFTRHGGTWMPALLTSFGFRWRTTSACIAPTQG